MPSKLPLEFHEPKCWQHTREVSESIPPKQKLVFRFGAPVLLCWGNEKENYVLQQLYTPPAKALVLVTIHVTEYTLLRVSCRQSFTAFQYTLNGNVFAYLKGNGCLPLLEDTYTLQYIPEGEHRVLLAPGTYHYFYMIPGPSINILSRQHADIDQVLKRVEEIHEEGKLATRLPMDSRVKSLLERLRNLPGNSPETAFTIIAIVIKLLRHYYRQLQGQDDEGHTTDLRARVNAFLANHIQEPVPALIKGIKKYLFMEANTLRNHWSHSNKGREFLTPRTSFKTLRMEYTLYLLVVEQLSVSAVADRLNFKNPFTFSQQFHKQFGVPPTRAGTIVAI